MSAKGETVITRLAGALIVLSFGLFAPPFVAHAQQAGKVPRVGVLHPGSSNEAATVQRDPFERGLRELGWNPGSNILIDYRYGEGNPVRLAEQAADLVRSGVDLIVARSDTAVRAARRATATIPIVMSAGTEILMAEGLVKSLSRPGGNITGISVPLSDLDAKRLELLRDAFPGIRRVAVITNPNFDAARYEEYMTALHANARSLKLQVESFPVRRADEVADAFTALVRDKFDALMVRPDPFVLDHQRHELAALAAKHRLPAIYPWRFFVDAGGLMSYNASLSGFHHRAATYVSRILKGEKPADLPIEQPTIFELVVNVAAARAQGLTIPQSVLFRADQLIQ